MELSANALPDQQEVNWLKATIQDAVETAIRNTQIPVSTAPPDEVLSATETARLLTTKDGRNLTKATVVNLTNQGVIPGVFLGPGLGWRYSKNAVLAALSTTQPAREAN